METNSSRDKTEPKPGEFIVSKLYLSVLFVACAIFLHACTCSCFVGWPFLSFFGDHTHWLTINAYVFFQLLLKFINISRIFCLFCSWFHRLWFRIDTYTVSFLIIFIALLFHIYAGFGTKDASKTDEFCNNIRMEQYRQVLKKEALLSKKLLESNSKRLKELQGWSFAIQLILQLHTTKIPCFENGIIYCCSISRTSRREKEQIFRGRFLLF